MLIAVNVEEGCVKSDADKRQEGSDLTLSLFVCVGVVLLFAENSGVRGEDGDLQSELEELRKCVYRKRRHHTH